MTIRITGTMARDAWHTVGPDGRARLHVHVHTGAEPDAQAHAVMHIGQGPAAQIAASNAAHHLRKGAPVIVCGAGLQVAPHGGHLVVAGCTDILRNHGAQIAAATAAAWQASEATA